MIYPDRCMLKWQGMLLSDHNERMRADQIRETCEKEPRYHTEADYETWDQLIQKSKRDGQAITLLISRPNEPEFSVTGVIQSVKSNRLTLLTGQGLMIISRHEVEGVS